MVILFENACYDTQFIKHIGLQDRYFATAADGRACIGGVGYFFSEEVNDAVFILPKVFLKKDGKELMAFGKFRTTELTSITSHSPLDKKLSNNIFSISIWIYQAIRRYILDNPESTIVTAAGKAQSVSSRNGSSTCTLIDIILSLIDFHKEHQILLTYISLISNSGRNKVHWSKSISHSQAYFIDDQPFYFSLLRRGKTIDYDEQLIVLFYSVLNYLNEQFAFNIQPALSYNILSSERIESLISTGKGTRLLKSIRKRYFKDELVQLWNLLYTFFSHCENVKTGKSREGALLAKDFNIVFETMVDSIISDSPETLPYGLREQRDGKVIDHIYRDNAPFGSSKIYYIGDSKYYIDGDCISGESIYKQFTYARNVIQECIRLSYTDPDIYEHLGLRYRDPETEGYCPTPNFFIRGSFFASEEDAFDVSALRLKKLKVNEKRDISFQFTDRLFDRDTLILMTFEVNFLYILHAYVARKDTKQARRKMHSRFRQEFIKTLHELYNIREADLSSNSITKNFQALIGRIFIPDDNSKPLMAERKTDNI